MSTQQLLTKRTVVHIGGMGCSGCADTIQVALESKMGVSSATVDFEKETASITYNADTVSTDDFKQTIEKAGYEFNGIQ